ncbi:MAG: hypothetical protein U1A27_09145 [Phycisphaerae bacterium]
MRTLARSSIAWLGCLALVSSCTPTAWLNLTVTRRGTITIGFINNTPFRANFTFGGYDVTDQSTVPVFGQLRVEGNTSAAQQTQACRRVFSVGGDELIRLIRQQNLTVNDAPVLHENIFFSSAAAGDPLAAVPTEGTAQQRILLDGVDYLCAGVLVFSYVQDAAAPGGFRMDYMFIEPTPPALPAP